MQLSNRIRLTTDKLKRPTKEIEIIFDDPPGYSPARTLTSLYGLESPFLSLKEALGNKVNEIEAGGVHSDAFTGESYAILWFALGGIAGGVFGAIGQDIWDALKKACKKIMERNGSRRNVVEIVLIFDIMDLILHYESRNPYKLSDMLDDGDVILRELQESLSQKVLKAKTIELRLNRDGRSYECVLYSYRRGKKFIQKRKKK
jgi:hypothetical protein